ncbi:MAG: hypothetical protein PHF24_05890, partial [Syntrophomonas sp.]|nr:hypothetical protein [Syntrophomonas sp.]
MLPPLDSRDTRALIQQIKEMLPYYTPEWRFSPEDPDAGTALLLIFTRMFDGTIKRLNQVPRRNLAAFLNMMDINLLPACPASAFLTFKLSSINSEAVLVPKGTQVLADIAGGEQVVFETEANLLVSPAIPAAIFTTCGLHDRIAEVPADLLIDNLDYPNRETTLMDCRDGENLQEHCLFLAEPDLLNINRPASIELEIGNIRQQFRERIDSALLADPDNTEWFYWQGDNWTAFAEVNAKSNRIELIKQEVGWIDYSDINGVNSRWLCCRVRPGKIEVLKDIGVSDVKMRAANLREEDESGFAPDMLFYNDIPLDPQDCLPFGEFFRVYDTFYFASQEAFSKKKAIITVSFKLKHEPRIMSNDNAPAVEWKMIMKKSDLQEPERPNLLITRVIWEYYNGKGWVKLFADSQYEDIFLHVAERTIIRFKCPEDIQPCINNDQMNYWIRARVLSIHNIYAPNGVYQAPRLEKIRLGYGYVEENMAPAAVLSLNNLEYIDHGQELEQDLIAQPFIDLDLITPALYLGFEHPPRKGPLSLFFSMREQKYDPEDTPVLEWEYSARKAMGEQWSKLDAIDNTNNLSGSGLLVFAEPADLVIRKIWGRKLFWLRAVNYDGKFDRTDNRPVLPVIKGLFMNTIRVIQQESAFIEMLSNPGGESNFGYTLPRTPIVSNEVWVEESGQLNEQEKQDVLNDNSLSLKVIRDEWGSIDKLWIKWQQVEDLSLSAMDERHYSIDSSSGQVCFGDGVHGRIPPRSSINNIEIKYRIGGGSQGNVGAKQINRLRNSLPFIDSVFNPEPACGGCDRESFDEVMHRGPKTLKHNGRAVTSSDFETLTREVSRNVAKVKCLPNTNWRIERESGCITLVVLPRGGVKASLT